MHHYGRNLAQSTTRPVPNRVQTQSHQQQRVNRYSSETLSPQPTPHPSSRRLPPGSSFNFFSVVSKFEALDALSPSCKDSNKGAAPYQSHITSPTLRGRTHNNFAGTFSPRRESKVRDVAAVEDHGSQSITPNRYAKQSCNNINPSYYAKPSYNRNYIPERKSAQTPGPIYKSSGSKPQYGLPSETSAVLGKEWESPELRKVEDRTARLSLIRDRISYFDGAMDTIAPNETTPYPTEAPKTPLAQMQMANKNAFSLSNTLSAKRNITPRRIQPDTPTDFSPLAIQKKRNLVFGQTTPNPSIQSSSPPKSWTKTASPTMFQKEDSTGDHRGRTLERSLVRSSKASHPPVSSRMRGNFTERNGTSTPREQSPKKTTPSREYESPLSARHRDPNITSTTTYKQNGLEVKRGSSRETEQYRPRGKQNSPRFDRPQYQANSGQNMTSTLHKQEPKSKVAMMKSLFERGSSAKDMARAVDNPPLKPTAISVTIPKPYLASVESSPNSSNLRSVRYNSVVSPESDPIPAKVSVNKITSPFKSYMSNDQSWGVKSRTGIRDETREFQPPQNSMSTLPQQPYQSLTRPPLQTTTNSSQRPPLQITNITPKHTLSARDIQDIYSEVQEAERANRAKKRKTFIEKWNFKLPGTSLHTVGVDGTEDLVSLSQEASFVGDMSGEVIVVKEADCGLREPKPLRITEMKRMMLLCRGRSGVLTAENKARHRL